MMTLSYTFNGSIDTSYEAWDQWIADAMEIFNMLGYQPNYYGFGVVGRDDIKIHPIRGMKRKIENAKKIGADILDGGFLVLPENFRIAAFDYIITLSRCRNYETLILNKDYEMHVDEGRIVELLRRNIHAVEGEIYEMDMEDCPEMYARKANPGMPIKSYKHIAVLNPFE